MSAKLHYYKFEVLRWRISETRARCIALGGELGTAAMSVYRELMDYCYTEGSVPADLGGLAAAASCPVEVLKKVWPVLQGKFEPHKKQKNRLVMRTVDTRIRKQKRESLRQSENALRRWQKRGSDNPIPDSELDTSGMGLAESGNANSCQPDALNKKLETRNKKQETTNGASRHREPHEPPPDRWSLTLAAMREYFPAADEILAERIAFAAIQAKHEASDADVSTAVHATFRRAQKSPGLWLQTIPIYLKSGTPKPPVTHVKCVECQDTGRVLRSRITEQPNWIDFSDAQLYEPCANCKGVAVA